MSDNIIVKKKLLTEEDNSCGDDVLCKVKVSCSKFTTDTNSYVDKSKKTLMKRKRAFSE
jgi:hypothetical protein